MFQKWLNGVSINSYILSNSDKYILNIFHYRNGKLDKKSYGIFTFYYYLPSMLNIISIRQILKQNEEALLIDPHNKYELMEAIINLYNNVHIKNYISKNAFNKVKKKYIKILFFQN